MRPYYCSAVSAVPSQLCVPGQRSSRCRLNLHQLDLHQTAAEPSRAEDTATPTPTRRRTPPHDSPEDNLKHTVGCFQLLTATRITMSDSPLHSPARAGGGSPPPAAAAEHVLAAAAEEHEEKQQQGPHLGRRHRRREEKQAVFPREGRSYGSWCVVTIAWTAACCNINHRIELTLCVHSFAADVVQCCKASSRAIQTCNMSLSRWHHTLVSSTTMLTAAQPTSARC